MIVRECGVENSVRECGVENILRGCGVAYVGRRVGLACVAMIVALIAWSEASAQTLAPHRALYQMRLATAEPSSGVIGARGKMYFEWTRACDGWRVNQHVTLELALGENESTTIRLLFSGWEAGDGSKMRFALERTSDGTLIEEIAGEAALDADGGEARFEKPTVARLTLPPGTLFPTEYWLRLLRRLADGESRFKASVFDGSTVDGAYEVTTFFGDSASRTPPGDAVDSGNRETVWPLRSAYFMHGQNDPEPMFEVGETINAAGIAYHFDLDYGWYTVRAELERFEAVALPSCPD